MHLSSMFHLQLLLLLLFSLKSSIFKLIFANGNLIKSGRSKVKMIENIIQRSLYQHEILKMYFSVLLCNDMLTRLINVVKISFKYYIWAVNSIFMTQWYVFLCNLWKIIIYIKTHMHLYFPTIHVLHYLVFISFISLKMWKLCIHEKMSFILFCLHR